MTGLAGVAQWLVLKPLLKPLLNDLVGLVFPELLELLVRLWPLLLEEALRPCRKLLLFTKVLLL